MFLKDNKNYFHLYYLDLDDNCYLYKYSKHLYFLILKKLFYAFDNYSQHYNRYIDSFYNSYNIFRIFYYD